MNSRREKAENRRVIDWPWGYSFFFSSYFSWLQHCAAPASKAVGRYQKSAPAMKK